MFSGDFFVSLSATLRENGWTDLHEIFREGVEWPWDDLITFWVNSGQRSICLLSPAIAQTTGVNKSVSFARWQQGGRGLLCRAPQLVNIVIVVPSGEFSSGSNGLNDKTARATNKLPGFARLPMRIKRRDRQRP